MLRSQIPGVLTTRPDPTRSSKAIYYCLKLQNLSATRLLLASSLAISLSIPNQLEKMVPFLLSSLFFIKLGLFFSSNSNLHQLLKILKFLVHTAAVLLVLQGVGGQRSDSGAQERSSNQRDPSLRRSVPQHQARKHQGRRSGQVSSHGSFSFPLPLNLIFQGFVLCLLIWGFIFIFIFLDGRG